MAGVGGSQSRRRLLRSLAQLLGAARTTKKDKGLAARILSQAGRKKARKKSKKK
jgi:hypothetical protein